MSFNLRDNQPTVVYCDTDVIRAIHGLGELLALPTVTLRACYAVPRASSSSKSIESNEVMEVDAAQETNSNKSNWIVGEEFTNAQKEIGFEEKYELRWPFRNSKAKAVDDWDGREYILTHLYTLLGLKIPANTSSLLLVPPASPPSLPLSTQAAYTQIAFESLNVPAFSIFPLSLASLYALGSTTGIVIDLGRTQTTVFVVIDSVVRWEAAVSIDVGADDCEAWFTQLLLDNAALDAELKSVSGKETLTEEEKRQFVKEISQVVWNECTGDDIEVPLIKTGANAVVASTQNKEDEGFDVAKKLVGDNAPPPATHSHKSKKQQAQIQAAAVKAAAASTAAAEAADTIVISIPSLPEKEIQLGSVRHRLCEPLFKGKTPGSESVWEGVGRAVENAGLSGGERLLLWEGISVVGELAKIKSIAPALVTYLSPYLLSSTDLPSDCQPAKARLLTIPEYFANFKNSTGDVVPFIGASIIAKVAFSDSAGKHCVTKIDYNSKGPAAIYSIANEDR